MMNPSASLVWCAACFLSLSGATLAQSSTTAVQTSAEALGLTYLQSDVSREQLFAEMREQNSVSYQKSIQTFDLSGKFTFPDNVTKDSNNKPRNGAYTFGVDISHHSTSDFPIDSLRQKKITFLYIKATQGKSFLDPKFALFWAKSGSQPAGSQLHRGAFHFLSSDLKNVSPEESGVLQARTFIKVINANGGIRSTDMPPVVDLEWDKATAKGPDRWRDRKPDEIIRTIKSFMETVESELHRKPMIYTARSWWRERIGSENKFSELQDYPLWLADYSLESQQSESPGSIMGTRWVLWQYTDKAGMLLGYNRTFDASVFKGTEKELFSALNVKEF